MKNFINSMTVRELKEYVRDLPEHDNVFGEEYEVWLSSDKKDNASNIVVNICRLNRGDIILSTKSN